MRVERRALRRSEKDQKLRPRWTRLSPDWVQELAETWDWLPGLCPSLSGP